MSTEDMIRELRNISEKYKDKFVATGDINWSMLCEDAADRLEELDNKLKQVYHDENT